MGCECIYLVIWIVIVFYARALMTLTIYSAIIDVPAIMIACNVHMPSKTS